MISPGASLLHDLRQHHGRQLARTLALMLAGALAEGVGLLILVPMLALAGTGDRSPPHGILAAISPGLPPFVLVLVLFAAVMTLRALLLYARDQATARLEAVYDMSLRARAATTLAGRGWPFAASLGQPGMQSLLANDVPRTLLAVHQGLVAATAAVVILIQLVVAAWLAWPMALGAFALILLGLPWLVALARRSHHTGEAIMASQEDSSRAVFGFHAGLKAALAQRSTGPFLADYRDMLAAVVATSLAFTRDLARSRARHAIVAALGAAAVIGIGHALGLALPRLLALLVLFARMSGPAQALQQSLAGIAGFASAFARIIDRLGPLGALPTTPPAAPPAPDWQRLGVTRLALDRGHGTGLAPTDFALDRGEWLALAGPSGAGKTTLIDLVAGLLEPTGGAIMLDGVALTGPARAAWQSGLSYVGQQESPLEPTLLAALGPGVTEVRAWLLLDLVGLADQVRAMPLGLATALTDRGARLSGGERQRLLIARALARDPSLLILDEATAALDPSAEEILIRRVRAAFPRMAALLVAHRAESSALCDRTLIIEGCDRIVTIDRRDRSPLAGAP